MGCRFAASPAVKKNLDSCTSSVRFRPGIRYFYFNMLNCFWYFYEDLSVRCNGRYFINHFNFEIAWYHYLKGLELLKYHNTRYVPFIGFK